MYSQKVKSVEAQFKYILFAIRVVLWRQSDIKSVYPDPD